MTSMSTQAAAEAPVEEKMLGLKRGAVAEIVFNNPARHNAVSLDMWERMTALLADFAADPALRVLVVSGAGGKAFVSGADISKFETERASAEAIKHYNQVTAEVSAKLAGFAKPVIAQITGSCVGGGVGIAMCCDLRICGESSRFGIPAAKLGLGYGFNGINRLAQVVGPSFAKEIFFTARLFSAEEARQMGLVNRVLPDDQVEAYVADYARMITDNAPLTIASVKAIVGETQKDASERDLEHCAALVDACYASQDYIEGRRAFMEKRKPQFVGS
jgi:enoyl-CoA hydratase/carnithine racemase